MAIPRNNPYSAFNFIVEIDNSPVAAFQEVSGLDSENTPMEYREGGDAMNTVRKLPGIEKYPNHTLKRGITGNLALWEWRKQVRDGALKGNPPAIEPQTVSELQRLRDVEKKYKRLLMEHDLLKKAIRFASEQRVRSSPSSRQTGKRTPSK